MNRILFYLPLLLFLQTSLYAQEKSLPSISFGPVVSGEGRIDIDLDEFTIKTNVSKLPVQAKFVPSSTGWIRVASVLLIPRARLEVYIQSDIDANEISLKYNVYNILFQQVDGKPFTSFFISLFEPCTIDVFHKGENIGTIEIFPGSKTDQNKAKIRHVIDYTCAPYNLDITGLEGEYFSAGCKINRSGSTGSEKGNIDVILVSPDHSLINGGKPPFLVSMTKNAPVRITLLKRNGEKKEIQIKADVPLKIHRLSTALGFGPYVLDTYEGSLMNRGKLTMALMIYTNFYLSPEYSIRAFEALFFHESFFNNLGLYFAYDLYHMLDNRFVLTALLGFQGLSFKHAGGSDTYNRMFYPQGFEFVFRHIFGLKNYSASAGMFLFPLKNENYENLWLRFGKKIFLELNYISWKKEQREVVTWGLSLGIPLISVF
jgi:hypothetical protein